MSDDNVVLLQFTEFSIFKIPPLQPHIAGIDTNALAAPQTPLLRIVCPLEGAVFSSPSAWHPGVSSDTHPYHFDAIGGDDEGKTAISRFVVKPITGAGSMDGMPSVIPVAIDSIGDDDLVCDAPRFRSARLSGNNRMLCWLDDISLKVNLSVMPIASHSADGGQGTRQTQTSGVLWRWPSLRLQGDCEYGFCPMAGRLCVSSWDQEIRVLDYIGLPS